MSITDAVLDRLIERGASTAHLVPGEAVAIRGKEGLFRLEESPEATIAINEILGNSLSPTQRQTLDRVGYADASLAHGGNRFICRLFHERGRIAATIRFLPQILPSLSDLIEVDDELARFAQILQFRRGLILITGSSGSGKSSLSAAILAAFNANQVKRIATVEDPPEYDIISRKSLVTQQMIGHDVDSFHTGLDAVRGLDADIVFVSALPDYHAFEAACTLVQSGRLVVAVMPYANVSGCIKGVFDSFSAGHPRLKELFSQSLQAIVSTTLIHRINLRERAAAHEIMIATLRIRGMLMEGRWEVGPLMKDGRQIGMQLFDDSLTMLYRQGIISFEEAESRVADKTILGRRGDKDKG